MQKKNPHKPNKIPLDVLENFQTCSFLSWCAIRHLCSDIKASKIISVKLVILFSNTLIAC